MGRASEYAPPRYELNAVLAEKNEEDLFVTHFAKYMRYPRNLEAYKGYELRLLAMNKEDSTVLIAISEELAEIAIKAENLDFMLKKLVDFHMEVKKKWKNKPANRVVKK